MALALTDQKILCTLLDIYCNKKSAVSSDEIADILDRHSGTIRNRMPILINLGFVDSVPGPKGGYIPTTKAYSELGFGEKSTILSTVSKIIDGKKVKIKGVNVCGIEIIGIAHLKKCGARIKVVGNIKGIKDEDTIKIDSIPPSGLVVVGKIVGRDDVRHILLIEVLNMYFNK